MEVIMLNEIIQTIELVDKIDNRKESRLKPKTKVNHMNTRTTKQTIQISENVTKQLSEVSKQIVNLKGRNSIKEIRGKLKTEVGSIITNAVRESYLLGLHFIEGFAEQTIPLTNQHLKDINKEIELQIDSYWKSVTRILDEDIPKTAIVGAASPRDLVLVKKLNDSLDKSSTSMTFASLNQATIAGSEQIYKKTVPGTKITITATLTRTQLLWVSERDNRVCPVCLNLDGRSWYVNDKSMPKPVKDSHFGCRCRLLPLVGNKAYNA